MKKIILIIPLLLLVLASCAVYQSVQGPIVRVLRRGSCVAIDIPPITLTPERTAAERQLMGKETEIEPDGWLIASAQSSTGAGVKQESSERRELTRYYIELGTLDFYQDAISYYKGIGLLGESYDGRLLPVPLNRLSESVRETYLSERKTALMVAKEVNESRKWLNEYRAKHPDEFPKPARSPYDASKAGEWIFTPSKQWLRVR